MKAFGLARLGRDAEIRYTQNGEPVASLSLAFSYGRKGDDGKRPTQWVDGSLWGKRAEALAPFLTKGSLVVVTMEDVHTEAYQGRNGEATKLVGRVTDIELAGGGERQQAAPAQAPVRQRPTERYQSQSRAPRAAPAAAPAPANDFEDDVPFASASMYHDLQDSISRRMRRYNF